MKQILTSLFLCLALFGCKDKKENDLIVATSADYPPLEFFKDGEIVGMEIDLIRAIAKELNYSVTIKDMSFDSIIGALQTERVDLAISGISATPERKEKVDFATPHHKTISVMLVSSTSTIQKTSDLTGKNVGAQMGSTYEKMIKDEWQPTISNLTLRSLSKIPDLIQDFKSGRLDALVLGIAEGEDIVKNHPNFKLIPLPKTEAVYAIALPKKSPLTEKINTIIKKFEANGTLKKLQDKWTEKGQ
ncbi:MAG: ABC transporter substrate-binding protein [Alphaproteobacteria bacterium]|jgi:ABC-type amino acid transport substrate-binding protein|nr:ABC transporter substrate-binding protein [Alphaproteobacteria bacterium]